MMLSYCLECRKNTDSKNPKKLTGVKIAILSDLPSINTLFENYKMNAIVNKLLLTGDKFMPEIHLKQPGFTYSACGPFTKNKERIKKFKEIGDSRRFKIYQNELDKACFQHDMAYGDFKDLNRRTVADKVLHDKAFNIAKNLKYDGYQRGLASMVYKFFDKKTLGRKFKNENISNKELSEELHKPIMFFFIRKFFIRK